MITTIADTRPNRLTQTKDEKYHLSWGRYAIWAGYNNPIHTLWINRVLTHEQFYRRADVVFDRLISVDRHQQQQSQRCKSDQVALGLTHHQSFSMLMFTKLAR